MKIAVYCSANEHIDPDFFHYTEELGQWMAREGHTLVYGGASMGLMECIGRTVHENGGTTIGVVPRILEQGGRVSQAVDIEIPCDNLSDRKDLMLDHADICIALPGGIGTLDELFSVAASHTIGYHHKHIILYNMKGFWNTLIALLEDLQTKGMIRRHYTDYIAVADNLDDIIRLTQ